MAHAKFSPSAAHRWMKCTASPSMEIGLDDESSEAANRGTLLHAVGEITLRRLTVPNTAAAKVGKRDLSRAFDLAFRSVYENGTKEIGFKEARKLLDRDEADELVLPYVEFVLAQLGKGIAAGFPWGVERKVDASFLGGECWGTADAVGYYQNALDVIDLKTGRHPVSPVKNWQGILYLLGAFYALPPAHQSEVTTCRFTIHQGGYPETWTVSPEELRQYAVEIQAALAEGATGGNLVAGEHCRWCLAKGTCPAFADRGLSLARSEFGIVTTNADPVQVIANMPGHIAADFLNRFGEIEVFMQTATELLAQRVYREGLEVPGYKVIRSTKHKAWADKDEAEKALRAQFGARAVKETLLTPTQAGKEFGDEAIAGLWVKPEGDLRLVTNATRGTAVTATAAIEFADGGSTAEGPK